MKRLTGLGISTSSPTTSSGQKRKRKGFIDDRGGMKRSKSDDSQIAVADVDMDVQSHRTGSMQFMAIEALQKKGHTYGYDLESFFYVFTWMCIRYDYEDVGQTSGLRRSTAKTTRTRPISTSQLRDGTMVRTP